MRMIFYKVRWNELSSAMVIPGICYIKMEIPMMRICQKRKDGIKDYVLLNIKSIHMNSVTLEKE